ncbi:hypothetical protein CYMTET_27177, partial [Cymbomonas tetramitiformis]
RETKYLEAILKAFSKEEVMAMQYHLRQIRQYMFYQVPLFDEHAVPVKDTNRDDEVGDAFTMILEILRYKMEVKNTGVVQDGKELDTK